MQLVILAAGKGTRMGDLSKETPKPMIKIKNKPILEYKLENLPKEIDEVIFIVGYKKGQIQDYFGDNFSGLKIKYVVQNELNGTGGAVHLVKDLVDDEFLVMMGDDLYYPQDLENLIKNDISISVIKSDNPIDLGVMEVDDQGNFVQVLEKNQDPTKNLVNIGLYKINKSFFNYDLVSISETEFGFPQTLAKMTKDFPIKIIESKKWQPVGNPEQLQKAEEIIDEFYK